MVIELIRLCGPKGIKKTTIVKGETVIVDFSEDGYPRGAMEITGYGLRKGGVVSITGDNGQTRTWAVENGAHNNAIFGDGSRGGIDLIVIGS